MWSWTDFLGCIMPQNRKWRWRWKEQIWTVLIICLVYGISGYSSLGQASFKFTQQSYDVSIPESPDGKAYAVPSMETERMGIPIPDSTVEVRYRVVSGDKRKIFRLIPRNVGDFCFCVLRPRSSSSNRLNRESENNYELTIEATVKGHPELIAVSSVNVTVLDRNDLNPLFYPTKYSANIDEDVPLHSQILQVTATDADAGLNGDIYYVLKNLSSHFIVHPRTGVISTVRRPVVDLQKDFKLVVYAQDRGIRNKQMYLGSGETASNAEVNVQVRRVNRNAPVVTIQPLPLFFTQTNPNVVALLQVMDADTGVHGEIDLVDIYEENGNFSTNFFITKAVGDKQYHVTAHDRERISTENLRVIVNATDRGLPAKSSSKLIDLSLVPPNDYAPKFVSDRLALEISENTPINAFLARINATDEDSGRNGRLTFSLITKTDVFRINNVTGWLILLRPLDRETRNIYELEIMVTDDALVGQRKSDVTKITLKISDENDNDPLFGHSELTVETAENDPVGTIVHIASARDEDMGDNAVISYSIANLNEIPFQVDPHSGKIRLTRTLDYEVDRREYRLRIRAADSGRPFRRETEMTLIVKLTPKNDNAPFFRTVDCNGTARITTGTRLMTLLAVDADENDAVTYKLLNDEEPIKKCFRVNQSSGDVMMVCDSRRDLPEAVSLKFGATDGVHDAEKLLSVQLAVADGDATADLPITIACQPNPLGNILGGLLEKSRTNNDRIDTFPHTPESVVSNRRTPKFPIDFPAIIHVDENIEVRNEVLQLNALDEDYGYNSLLHYAVTSDGDYFRSDPRGQLVVARSLDREERLTHSVNITVKDCGNPKRTSSRLLLVKLLDKNDNRPVFETASYIFRVTENCPSGAIVGHIRAVDIDEGLNGKVAYSRVSNRDPFTINPDTGAITVSGLVDYEYIKEYTIIATASDGSVDGSQTSSVQCRIIVEDLNDNAPVFPSSIMRISIPEDLPLGSVLTFPAAYDVDRGVNGQVEYSIFSENDVVTGTTTERKFGVEGSLKNSPPFAVDPFSGALSLSRPLDFEKVSIFNVSITAVDKGQPPLSSTAWVEIHVEDVDENRYAPKFKDFVLSASVLENQPSETFVTQVKATDEDGDGVQYSLIGGSGLHLFRLDSDGTVRTSVTFDRETQEHYWLKVLAKDTATIPRYSVLHCYIRIGDVNDNCPMTAEPIYYTSVPENSPPDTVVARMEAFDLDSAGSVLSFKISAGNPQGFFTIHEKTGVIRTTNRKFDRETQAEHTLEILISDNSEPALFSITHVVVTVQDVQDSAVTFLKEHLQRYVVPAWKPASALPLFRVVAFDSDIGTNAEIRFALVGKKIENERYRIDAKTGEVFGVLPLSVGEDYNVMVKASDPEDSALKKTIRILIEASAIPLASTEPPKIAPAHSAQVLETDVVGHMVILLEGEDPDGDMLWYYIVGGDPEKQFHIGPNSGSLIVARPLDWESRSNYTLTVNVTDGVHFRSTTVSIRVTDVNEHRPQFLKRSYIASVPENASPGTEVLRVSASDRDEEQRLLYSIYATGSPASQSKFAIDESSGVITTTEVLDRETTGQHMITVLVKDRGTQSHGDLARVMINVIDMNDHAPVFQEVPQPVLVPAASLVGTVVARMVAFDRDTGLNAEISYRLTGAQSLFEIDPVNGEVKLLEDASKLGSDEIGLKVEAADRGIPSLKTEMVILVKVADQGNLNMKFSEEEVIAKIAENLPSGSLVAAVSLEMQSFVTYHLVDKGNGDKNSFTIDPATGLLTTAASLDYEKQHLYIVNVVAVGREQRTATATVSVFVTDLNDNPPKVNFTSFVGIICESAPAGSAVLDVSGRPLLLAAYDVDSGRNRLLNSEIVEPEILQYFEILSTGSIRLRGQLDYEKQQQFAFHVRVADSGRPQLISPEVAKVTIDVVNINDSPPVFEKREYNFTVNYPLYPGSIVGALKATDMDNASQNGTLTYKITGGNSEKLFFLQSTTGVLRFNPVTQENISHSDVHLLTVQASDGIFLATARVIVSYSQVDNNGLKFSSPKYHIQVPENSTVAREIYVPELTGRFLNENLEFALLTVNPAFEINPWTGAILTTTVPLDREATSHVTLAIEAVSLFRDARRIARADIFVEVVDVNDNRPQFVDAPYQLAVPISSVNEAELLRVLANDLDSNDNSAIKYSIVFGDDSVLIINKTTGSVHFRANLTERLRWGAQYNFRIRATDEGAQPLFSETSLDIRIVTDAVPKFRQSRYMEQLSESSEVGFPIVNVEAFYGNNTGLRAIVYAIISGDPFNSFNVDFTTGVIRLAGPVDFEAQQQFALKIRAMDPAKWESVYSDVDVGITIQDANDNAPTFKDYTTFHVIKISETAPIGSEIFQVRATDADSGENAQLHYTLQWSEEAAGESFKQNRNRKADEDLFFRCGIQKGVSNLDDFKAGDYFYIDPSNGTVFLVNELDYEMVDQLDLLIIVSDFGHPRKSASMILRILVKDINDNAPCFTEAVYDFVVSDQVRAGWFVGGIATVDHDEDPEVSYEIISGDDDNLFVIDNQGMISFSPSAKGYLRTAVYLNVTASDGIQVSPAQISILPVVNNRFAPAFESALYLLSIPEDAALGTLLGSVHANDKDPGRNGKVRYSVVGDHLEDLVTIDAESGGLSLAGALDRERHAFYLFWVQVADMGGLRDFCRVNLSVSDVNDGSPVFGRNVYDVTVPANMPPESVVLRVVALDSDVAENGSVIYGINTASKHGNQFSIDGKTGTIKLRKPLKNGAVNKTMHLLVDARDEGKPPKYSSVPVNIFIVHEKEEIPEFSQQIYHISIHEGSPVNTTLVHAKIKQQTPVIYAIVPPSVLNQTLPFSVRSDGGIIVSDALDFDKQNEYRFFIAAVVGTSSQLVNHAEVRVRIIDENDNAPVFLADKFTVQAPENYTGSLRLLPVLALDADHGQNAELTYLLLDGEDSSFSVDPKSGWLTMEKTLDRESQQTHVLIIRATDGGNPALTATAIVEVQVSDLNDNPPYFQQVFYQSNVQEELVPDTPITTLQATDADVNSALEYYISKGDPFHRFTINSRGEVYVTAPLDREKQASYEVTVIATDGLDTASARLRIDVLDVNDNNPVCKKSYFREIVAEDMDIGHVILRMQATDADTPSQIEYYIIGDGSDTFAMDRTSGILRVKTNLDRELQDHFSLLGLASDQDGRSCSASIEILVTDVNDHAPTFSENLTVTTPEDTPINTLLYRLRAEDNDLGNNRLVKYSLQASDQGNSENMKTFSINETSGFLILIGEIDRERIPQYELRVRAKDMGQPQLWSMATLKFFVQNVRDDPPRFSSQQYQFHVAEDKAIGGEVGKIEAMSLDDAVQNDLSYRIVDGNQLGVFGLNKQTGLIIVTKSLDFERQPEYILFVEARDSSEPPLMATAQVLIHVTDVNDNPPIFTQEKYSTKISEDVAIGAQVVQLTASDIDTGISGELTYELIVTNTSQPFAVDSKSGWITVVSALDRESEASYSLSVRATDGGVPSLSSVAVLDVSVGDVNDNPPLFQKGNYSAIVQTTKRLQEKQPGGFTLFRFTITDADLEINGPPFTLNIASGNEEDFFQVVSSDLSLRTTRSLINRRNSEFHLQVTAKDNGDVPQSSFTWVMIRVVEESQFPPKINPLHISILSPDTKYAGGMIGRISASDPDIYDILRYDIASPELKSAFEADPLQGTLFSKPGVSAGQYDLNVSVTDGRFTTYEPVTVTINEIDDELLKNSVTVQLNDVSVEEFVITYKRDFVRAVRQIFGLRRNKDVHIISVQPVDMDAENDVDERRKRETTDFNESVEVLFGVSKGKNGEGFMNAEEIRRTLNGQMTTFENLLDLKGGKVVPVICKGNTCLFGDCVEELKLLSQWEAPYITVVGNNGQAYVFPRHRRTYQCHCRSGYGGVHCETLLSDCSSKQCGSAKVCMPVGGGEVKCVCSNGKDGTKCDQIPSTVDQDTDAVTYNGNSYAWYDLQKPIERHLSLSMKFKTRFGVGNLMYVAGRLDYSILEIKNGVVQYRFDCGSGEGLAKLEGIFVSDNQWHELSVQRHGRQAEIRLDGKFTAHATAPGINDILNLEGNDAFFGAEVPGRYTSSQRASSETVLRDVRRGFIGCMKNIQLNGVELPRIGRNPEATVVQLANLERGCHITTGELGPCASMPCQNGAACEPNSETAFICQCPQRFSGTLCENDSNPCASAPCLHGVCTNRSPNDFHCSCPAGLTGKRCEYGRYCNPNPCKNGGCEEGTFGPICQCLHGFEGSFCERDSDECLQSPCQNGGLCENLQGSFRCNCSMLYKGSLCEESAFMPNVTTRLGIGWTWIEILVVSGIVVLVTMIGVCAVLCRKRIRKRRTAGLENQYEITASPSTHTHINNEIGRTKLCNNRVAAEDTLVKRGSKISNLEVESRQPMLYGDHSLGNGSRGGKPRFRPLTPPPPSYSATSSETMSLNQKSNLNNLDDNEYRPEFKGFMVDMPTPGKSTSTNDFQKSLGIGIEKVAKILNSKNSINSVVASAGTSPMNSDDEDAAVPAVNGPRKELLWDHLGTTLEAGDSSAATATVSVDDPEKSSSTHNPLVDDDISESDCFDEADFLEDGLDESEKFLSPLQPPQPFQDLHSQPHLDDDYTENSTISKRFSDYIPAVDIDFGLNERRDSSSKASKSLVKADSELDLPERIAIPPPMPSLEGFTAFSKKRALDVDRKDLANGRTASNENGENAETVALLNGSEEENSLSDEGSASLGNAPNGGSATHKLLVKKPKAIGKQTQV